MYSAVVSELDDADSEESHPKSPVVPPIYSTLVYRYGDWLRIANAAAKSPHLSAVSSAMEMARNWRPSPQLTTAIEAFRAADFSTQITRLQRMVVPAVPKIDPAWLQVGSHFTKFITTLDLGEPRRYFPANWDPILTNLDFDLIDSDVTDPDSARLALVSNVQRHPDGNLDGAECSGGICRWD